MNERFKILIMISDFQIETLLSLCDSAQFELTTLFTFPDAELTDEQIALIAQIKKTIDELVEILYALKDAGSN